VLGNIPWVYGETRVTAMARDPHWIFVYWEVPDDAIERARAEVQSADAGCILRVYDTTHRLFDGTNANWYVDIPIYRPSNNHYVLVDRPGSTFHVDIGVKSAEGYFAEIARSAPIETPRNSISPDTRVDWMTVSAEGAPPRDYRHRFVPRWASPAPGDWSAELEQVMRSLAGEGWSRTEWSEAQMGGRTVRWVRWTGPFHDGHWRAIQPATFGRVEILFQGERRVIRMEHGERVVFGPWRVTIHGLDARGGQRIIDRWTIHYSWPTTGGTVRIETAPIVQRILQGYRTVLTTAGSEARLLGESWASESLQMGASEWHWAGASETWLAGASETFYLGASEMRYLGASETVSLGASETLFAGASEFVGGSELMRLGASESLGAASGAWPLPISGEGPA
jgi:hypothetical protein